MSRVTQLFARENAGALLALHETQSRDAIKYGRRTIAYVSIGADLWGQLLVDRFNQHEEIIEALRIARRAPGVHTTDQQTGETFAAVIDAAIAKADGR